MKYPLRVLFLCLVAFPPIFIFVGTWSELLFMKYLSQREYVYRYEGIWKCPLTTKHCYHVNDKNDLLYGREIALTKTQEKFLKPNQKD